ncbi:hypothetical protein C491_00612 [Natronococcus amylolyticus DSM 10524]|uniref:Uncharacterized protein n=1 Tax=Natronococcus amylolyticus DSM 10524 TaxID=1227497 RepID=L9XHU3_9EURY|nr:hypothetical protein C491_00612 [Natronococcus amylolyticus DSM 10524]
MSNGQIRPARGSVGDRSAGRNGRPSVAFPTFELGTSLVLITTLVLEAGMGANEKSEYEARFSEDGFFEVRECSDPDRWIACDSPVEIEQ